MYIDHAEPRNTRGAVVAVPDPKKRVEAKHSDGYLEKISLEARSTAAENEKRKGYCGGDGCLVM